MTDKLPQPITYQPVDGDSFRPVAKSSELAARIEALAASDGLLLEQDEALTSLLTTVPGMDEIPETLYAAIAEVLSFLDRMEEAADRS